MHAKLVTVGGPMVLGDGHAFCVECGHGVDATNGRMSVELIVFGCEWDGKFAICRGCVKKAAELPDAVAT